MAVRLGAYSLGFLNNTSLKRALAGAGYDVVAGPLHRQLDGVAVWGDRPVARRALAAAKRRGLAPIFVEDAFLKCVSATRSGPVIGLTIDSHAPYFDASQPTDLENLLNATDPAMRNNLAYDAYLDSGLSKYNDARGLPEALRAGPFVVVVDQRRDDASIRLGGADAVSFQRAMDAALDENPDVPVFIKQHPRSNGGHFDVDALPERVSVLPADVDPVRCLKMARTVYCVTSQLGFETILHGKRPRVFGKPFYAGWGLSDDTQVLERRVVHLSAEAMFRAVMQDYCRWFDPFTGEPVAFIDAMRGLHARAKFYADQRQIGVAAGFKPWKRRFVRAMLPKVHFAPVSLRAVDFAQRANTGCAVWASASDTAFENTAADKGIPVWKCEDGFLRSQGLGAALTPPGSLVFDDLGIYYDPGQASRLETQVLERARMPTHAQQRIAFLIDQIVGAGLSKYNLAGKKADIPESPGRARILVPGQVEDDASVLKGCGSVATNSGLLAAVRAENPDAFIVYKPHPDVEAGYRKGAVDPAALNDTCDFVLNAGDPLAAIAAVDEVWTMTSLLGFEALLRGRRVVCLGRPFYAGWGLTRDLSGEALTRRKPASLYSLAHAVLIDHPIYFCPQMGRVMSVEQHVARLRRGARPDRGAWAWAQNCKRVLRRQLK